MNILGTAFALLGASSLAFAEGDKKAYVPASYNVDAAHSRVGFEIPHLVISTVDGSFKDFEGTITLAEDFSKSKATVTAKIASIDTGVDKRDEHLKSADFFDVAKNPTMKFVSSSISGAPESFKLTGKLTIKGITKTVTFDGKYLGSVVDGYGNQKVAFQAKTVIKRKEFGLTWNNVVEAGPVVGDEVAIELKLQAARANAK